jgi:surface protein
MFCEAKSFNQPLNDWDVSQVTNMQAMFQLAKAFNQPLDQWDIGKVVDKRNMFCFATAFNQTLPPDFGPISALMSST